MTFDEVGAPARLSGGPSPATNIPVVHTVLMAIQSTFDLEPVEPRKRYEKNGRLKRSSLSKNLPNRLSSSCVRAILPSASERNRL